MDVHSLFNRAKRFAVMAHDLATTPVAIGLALFLSFPETAKLQVEALAWIVPLFTLYAGAVFRFFRLYEAKWRFASLPDLFNIFRAASTLAITTGSGVPILRALETSRDTLSNVAMKDLVEQATASVREGVSLARALSAQKLFPPMLVHMIRAGEITGELPAMLERASNSQQAELERRTLTIAGLLEPVLILAMGLVVLLIVLAVLMPIIEINQLVQ